MGRVVCLSEVDSWRSENSVGEGSSSSVSAATAMASKDPQEVDMGNPDKSGKGKKPLRGPFVPTVEEVHEAFDWIKAIRYNQPLHLGGESAARKPFSRVSA